MVLKDKKTKITFHNGILTIGGTIIEVVYEDSHIFFDFGSEYNPSASFQPSNLQELLDEKLVPYLNNMYDPSIELKGYKSSEDNFKHTAVFLSHMHLDHSKIINYLNPSIPLYTLEGTKSLLNTLNINDDFLFPLHNKKDSNTREIIGVKENEVIEVGKIKVKVMPVDHDAYGACGLLIKTPDLVISYTGDIRLHGYRKEDTLKFCKESENCDVLLIEGVTVSFKDFEDEDDEIIWVSKSEIKRDAEELKRLGAELVDLGKNALDKIPLDTDLRDAIELAQRIKKEGRRRQLQLIGKMLRNRDVDPIRQALDKLKNRHNQQVALFHKLEQIRDRLIDDGDDAVAEVLNLWPDADRQQLRSLIRNAKKEKEGNKPPKSARLIFQYLRELAENEG